MPDGLPPTQRGLHSGFDTEVDSADSFLTFFLGEEQNLVYFPMLVENRAQGKSLSDSQASYESLCKLCPLPRISPLLGASQGVSGDRTSSL